MKVRDYLDGLPAATLPPATADADADTVLSFDEARSSAFAKGVAGDFNPLHDPGHKRFCVPGDLLFAALLANYGMRADTSVAFSGMLGAHSRVTLPTGEAARADDFLHLLDERGREVLGYHASGAGIVDAAFRDALVVEYVRFSGKTFPHILVPLMREADVMINPARPLIIYKDMAIRLDAARVAAGAEQGVPPVLASGRHELSVTGKKGVASLRFAILMDGEEVGDGEKNFVLSGLREFDEAQIESVVADYEERKRRFLAAAA